MSSARSTAGVGHSTRSGVEGIARKGPSLLHVKILKKRPPNIPVLRQSFTDELDIPSSALVRSSKCVFLRVGLTGTFPTIRRGL